MEILLMNSMDKKKRIGFKFDLKIWVGFEKHSLNRHIKEDPFITVHYCYVLMTVW